jgi:uncharacterized GH25 family protein
MKKIITLFLLFCFISLSAHEFWLQPDKFLYKRGDKATIKFMVGENFEGANWSGNRSKINFLSLYSNGTKTDLSSSITDTNGDSLQFIIPDEGTIMVVYHGLNSYMELAADKFNAYLEEDGLREPIEYRRQHHEMDSAGREAYQRSVKTILQSGEKYDSSYKQPTPLPLDIIPLKHPYLISDKQKMQVKVLFDKKPLADQLIKIWHREGNQTIMEELLTDQDAIASFRIKRSGRWMVSTVKMIHPDNDPGAQWQSYWSSCTWGYE